MNKPLVIGLTIIAVTLITIMAIITLADFGEPWNPDPEPDPESFCGDGICDPDETHSTCPQDCPDPNDPLPPELGSIRHHITIYYTDETVAKIPTLSLFSFIHESKPVTSIIYTVEAKAKTGIISVSVEDYFLYTTTSGQDTSTASFYPTSPFETSVTTSWTTLTSIPIPKTDLIGMLTAGTYTITIAPSGTLSYKNGLNWESTILPTPFSFEVELTESELFLIIGAVDPIYD